MSKEPPKIKFGKIKGDVIISNDQKGGITAHNVTNNEHIPSSKGSSVSKWHIWIYIPVIAAILGILTYFGITYKSDKSIPKQIPPVKDTIKQQVENHKRTNKSNTMFSKKKDKTTTNESITIGDVTGDVVISKGQSGGITAHTVIVPEDKEIPLENNYSASFDTFEGKPAIKICPKHGTWGKVVLCVPLDVYDESKVDLRNGNGVDIDFASTQSYATKPNGESYPTKVFNIAGPLYT